MDDEIFDPEKLKQDRRRREWITVPGMGRLCVWQLTMAESVLVTEYSTRPAEDPRGGMDREESVLWQIALACYRGDTPDAKRVFDDHQVYLIRNLSVSEFTLIMTAINRVNGIDAQEEEILRDFTPATGARASSG